jgi:hypothetical protein
MMRGSLAAIALAALCACGNDPYGREGYDAALAEWRRLTAAAEAPQPLTRAAIEGFEAPLIRAAIPARGAESFLGLAMTDGPVETWWTPDQIALTLKSGILIGSRGLGEDLMAAKTPDIRRVRGAFERVHQYIGDNSATESVTWTCLVQERGIETVDLFGLAWSGRRIDETCDGLAGEFVNSYWIGGDGTIRQSQQWVSNSVGYVTIQRLID